MWDRSAMMSRLMGDETLAAEIIETFLADIPQRIEALGAFLENGKGPDARIAAHSIKGASANMGAEPLREAAFAVEKAARDGDLGGARALMANLAAHFDRLRAVMNGDV